MSAKEVRFLCVARRTDKAILASYTHLPPPPGSADYLANVTKVLNSPGWATITSDRLSLEDGPFIFYVLIDEAGRVYIAICSKGFPQRHVYGSGGARGLLAELRTAFLEKFGEASLTAAPGGLQTRAAVLLKGLAAEFSDLTKVDALASAQAKVDAVKVVMEDNVRRAIDNTGKIEAVDDKVDQLSQSASRFQSSATSLKRDQRCRMYKRYAFFSALGVGLLLLIIIPIAVSSSGD